MNLTKRFHDACLRGDLETVQKYASKVDVNAPDENGNTGLMLTDSYDVAKFLLENGANEQFGPDPSRKLFEWFSRVAQTDFKFEVSLSGQPLAVLEHIIPFLPKFLAMTLAVMTCDEKLLHKALKCSKTGLDNPWWNSFPPTEVFGSIGNDVLYDVYGAHKHTRNPMHLKMYDSLVKAGYAPGENTNEQGYEFYESRKNKR